MLVGVLLLTYQCCVVCHCCTFLRTYYCILLFYSYGTEPVPFCIYYTYVCYRTCRYLYVSNTYLVNISYVYICTFLLTHFGSHALYMYYVSRRRRYVSRKIILYVCSIFTYIHRN